MDDKAAESWRARAAVAEALEVFNSSYMQDVWAKALARRDTDPEGAVTSARALLESVCKYILDAENVEWREGAPLPKLYEQTAKVLNIAPTLNLAPVFHSIFTACADVIESIGKLRNELSDSHGRGPYGEMPNWRHAELAVNLSGAMATYLAAIWKGRQPTVGDVVRTFLAERRQAETLTNSARYPLERMARDMDDVVATKIRAGDLVTYFEERAAGAKLVPATVRKEFTLLKIALEGRSAAALESAAAILTRRKILPGAGSYVTPVRRVSKADFEAILKHFRDPSTNWRKGDRVHIGLAAGMADVLEFAVWCGRKPVDILKLRWADVDFQLHTCKMPGQKQPFPILERAWEIIEERRSSASEPEGRIFPYQKEAVIARHLTNTKALVAEGKIERFIPWQDYRHEAAYRLLEKGHPVPDVAQATGLPPARILKIAEEVQQGAAIDANILSEDATAPS